ALLGSLAEKTGSPPTRASPPTFSLATALERHSVPPDLVDNSSTDNSADTVASTRGSVRPARLPLGFTLETLRWPKNTTGIPRSPPSACAAAEPSSVERVRRSTESAAPSSSTSMPVWAASTYSEKRRVANSCSEPFAFSAVKVTSPICQYGDRLSRGGSSTRCEPPQAIPAKMKRTGEGRRNGVLIGDTSRTGGTQHNERRARARARRPPGARAIWPQALE